MVAKKEPKLGGNAAISAGLVVAVACAMGLALMFAGQSWGRILPDSAFFYSNGYKHKLIVSNTSFGIAVMDTVSSKRIRFLADSLGYSVVRELPQQLYEIGLQDTVTRDSIVEIAREFKDNLPAIVRNAGMVTTPVNGDIPQIITDEFIVQFHRDVDTSSIDSVNGSHAVQILKWNQYVHNQLLLKVTSASKTDALRMANRYHEMGKVKYAHPNFVRVIEPRQFSPDDEYYKDQWHLDNMGQSDGESSGTPDADIDADRAWEIESGNPATVIAVIDFGFEMDHPDLDGAFISGWDFDDEDNDPSPGTGFYNEHGTAVAGVIAARGNNGTDGEEGVAGVCPECSLLPIRLYHNDWYMAESFNYANATDADIITCSWGLTEGAELPQNTSEAIASAADNGAVIFIARKNTSSDDCVGDWVDISAHSDVIGVAVSTGSDRIGGAGIGECTDLLAPGTPATPDIIGELWAVTTDRKADEGYNPDHPEGGCPQEYSSDPDYTRCCPHGTSIAAPIAAGVAGLICSADKDNDGLTLTADQVRNLLFDTGDKIEDSKADYDPLTGFSRGSGGTPTHGFGRVNAFEAVRVVAPSTKGGKNGVDVFLRDNELDWGNTENPSYTVFESPREYLCHCRSMDIRVDSPPYHTAPTAATFDSYDDEPLTAVPGEMNRAYVRVRNRGPVKADQVRVKLLWTQFGTGLPPLPDDFWTLFETNSTNTTDWHPTTPMGSSTSYFTIEDLEYSGSMAAYDADITDAAQIARFEFSLEEFVVTGDHHVCLLAIVDSPQDEVSPLADPALSYKKVVDHLTPRDNNVTHRNYGNIKTSLSSRFIQPFYVRNPFPYEIKTRLRYEGPEKWKIGLDSLRFGDTIVMAAGKEILAQVSADLLRPNQTGEVTIIQDILKDNEMVPLGGLTLGFKGTAPTGPIPEINNSYPYLIGSYDLRHGRYTTATIINPTAKYLRVLVAFYDDNENKLACTWEKLSPNDMVEIDVRRYVMNRGIGVVKAISFNVDEDTPDHGIVGFQRHYRKTGFLFWRSYKLRAEAPLQPVTYEVLKFDLENILAGCP